MCQTLVASVQSLFTEYIINKFHLLYGLLSNYLLESSLQIFVFTLIIGGALISCKLISFYNFSLKLKTNIHTHIYKA